MKRVQWSRLDRRSIFLGRIIGSMINTFAQCNTNFIHHFVPNSIFFCYDAVYFRIKLNSYSIWMVHVERKKKMANLSCLLWSCAIVSTNANVQDIRKPTFANRIKKQIVDWFQYRDCFFCFSEASGSKMDIRIYHGSTTSLAAVRNWELNWSVFVCNVHSNLLHPHEQQWQ